jgi:hypothetical protein
MTIIKQKRSVVRRSFRGEGGIRTRGPLNTINKIVKSYKKNYPLIQQFGISGVSSSNLQ